MITKKVILMNEIERLALCFLALGHYADSEAQYQKLAMKNKIFAVFTLNKKAFKCKPKMKNPQENLHWKMYSDQQFIPFLFFVLLFKERFLRSL